MKKRIFVAALLTMLFVGINNTASAHPWGCRGGWYGPRIGVRIGVPVPVVVGGYYGPGYYGPAYRGGYYHRPYAYYRPHYAPHYYGHHYGPRRY